MEAGIEPAAGGHWCLQVVALSPAHAAARTPAATGITDPSQNTPRPLGSPRPVEGGGARRNSCVWPNSMRLSRGWRVLPATAPFFSGSDHGVSGIRVVPDGTVEPLLVLPEAALFMAGDSARSCGTWATGNELRQFRLRIVGVHFQPGIVRVGVTLFILHPQRIADLSTAIFQVNTSHIPKTVRMIDRRYPDMRG